jgi:hypothetical protein
MGEKIQLRTFAFLDNMQPQYAALTGTVVKGDVALAGMAQLYIEMTPGSEIYRLLNAALKCSNAKPGFLIVEREYGEIELHSFSIDDVQEAGRAILGTCGLSISERLKPRVVSQQIITNVDPYQSQLINRTRHGSLLLPAESLFIMEVEPAAYISIAVNEAEKKSDIKIIDFDPVGRYGRMYVSGTESEVKAACQAAIAAIEAIDGLRGDENVTA